MQIKFKQVGFSYPAIKTKYEALKDINLTIDNKGEFIAICGKTGSGKSTLVQIMNGLLIPTTGSCDILGQKLPPKKREKINHLRRKVGLVFQFPEYQLFAETVLKDIEFGPKNFKETKEEARTKALKASKMVGLDDNLLNKSPFKISCGQMRRTAIAGIIAMDPDILILDEPTRGLDPKGRNDIMDMLKNIHNKTNKTIIIITHDMDIVSRYAKRVIVLDKAMIIFDGDKKDLFKNKNFNKFHLNYPTPIEVLNYLNKELGIDNNKTIYTYEELLNYLKDYKL